MTYFKRTVRCWRDVLRDLGLFVGVNDAEAMKRLRPRFEPAAEDEHEWTELHAKILSLAFERVLGKADSGSVAFVRCLTPDVVQALPVTVLCSTGLASLECRRCRTMEARGPSRRIEPSRCARRRQSAALLLVDTARAGAGMDGIYSAAREVDEASLFGEALRLAGREVKNAIVRQTPSICGARGQEGTRIRPSLQRLALDRV